jgi:hypothetical protein
MGGLTAISPAQLEQGYKEISYSAAKLFQDSPLSGLSCTDRVNALTATSISFAWIKVHANQQINVNQLRLETIFLSIKNVLTLIYYYIFPVLSY